MATAPHNEKRLHAATMVSSEYRLLLLRFFIAALCVGSAFWFFRHERGEFAQLRPVLAHTDLYLLLPGLLLTALYILAQAMIYRCTIHAAGALVPRVATVRLFLKRNLISLFLPAGGVSSLAFFTQEVEEKGATRTQVGFASGMYAFLGMSSLLLLAIPVLLAAGTQFFPHDARAAVAASGLLLLALLAAGRSLLRKGAVFRAASRLAPGIGVYVDELLTGKFRTASLWKGLAWSMVVECTGIVQLYIAARAVGTPLPWGMAIIGYVAGTLPMALSPLMRGLGAVEVSLTLVLGLAGIPPGQALAVVLLYRLFEFWAPLLAGVAVFLLPAGKLLMRLLPALFLALLGVVNIASALTPGLHERMRWLRHWLPHEVISASHTFTLAAGLFCFITAAFLLKGMRRAWSVAIALCLLSMATNLAKGVDVEEAAIALAVLLMLLRTRAQYVERGSRRMGRIGVSVALIGVAAVLAYGIIGFYFLDPHQFGTDFSLRASIIHTMGYYLFYGIGSLQPLTHFGAHFLASISISGALSLGFLTYCLVQPYVPDRSAEEEDQLRAAALVERYGNSAMDHFKAGADKDLHFGPDSTSFLAYRCAAGFAVALEDAVGPDDAHRNACIADFMAFCRRNGMRPLLYRVPQDRLVDLRGLGLKALPIGQEGRVDLHAFSLEGGARKSLRNGIRKTEELGWKVVVYRPPVQQGVLQKLKQVSKEWLQERKTELAFSQGAFDPDELRGQTVIALENAEGRVAAFFNMIPDHAPGECTYDLARKANDAPNGAMDALMVGLFQEAKAQGARYAGLGFAPFSGMGAPATATQRTMKFAYERIRGFAHFRGLREYKDKFNPEWSDRFLVYQHDFDLIQAPIALRRVMEA